jgi:hypothetical protein
MCAGCAVLAVGCWHTLGTWWFTWDELYVTMVHCCEVHMNEMTIYNCVQCLHDAHTLLLHSEALSLYTG